MQHSIIRVTDSYLLHQCRNYIDVFHSYIQYSDRPSRKLYWCLFEDGNMVGVFALGSCFSQNKQVREYMNLRSLSFNEVANNIVYCLSGHQDKNAGSKFLSLCRQDAVNWWQERYGDELKAFQTFILPPRTGAVYKADNWEQIGLTSGNAQKSRTIRLSDLENHPEAKKQESKSGEVRWIVREYAETEQKLIFMRLVTEKDKRRAMNQSHGNSGTQCECHFSLDRQLALF